MQDSLRPTPKCNHIALASGIQLWKGEDDRGKIDCFDVCDT